MLSSPETIEIIHGEDKDDFFGFAIEQKLDLTVRIRVGFPI
jgi:hypothetical protein